MDRNGARAETSCARAVSCAALFSFLLFLLDTILAGMATDRARPSADGSAVIAENANHHIHCVANGPFNQPMKAKALSNFCKTTSTGGTGFLAYMRSQDQHRFI
ncbi:hypothetical protein JYK21_18930 [Ralstonia pickettii]|nr:hypothetical protein [Ralstonia pickettii]